MLVVYTRFWRFSQAPTSTGKNNQLKPGKLKNLIGHIGNKTRQVFNIIALIFRVQHFFNAGPFY